MTTRFYLRGQVSMSAVGASSPIFFGKSLYILILSKSSPTIFRNGTLKFYLHPQFWIPNPSLEKNPKNSGLKPPKLKQLYSGSLYTHCKGAAESCLFARLRCVRPTRGKGAKSAMFTLIAWDIHETQLSWEMTRTRTEKFPHEMQILMIYDVGHPLSRRANYLFTTSRFHYNSHK